MKEDMRTWTIFAGYGFGLGTSTALFVESLMEGSFDFMQLSFLTVMVVGFIDLLKLVKR